VIAGFNDSSTQCTFKALSRDFRLYQFKGLWTLFKALSRHFWPTMNQPTVDSTEDDVIETSHDVKVNVNIVTWTKKVTKKMPTKVKDKGEDKGGLSIYNESTYSGFNRR
jgi:hypothetical protein